MPTGKRSKTSDVDSFSISKETRSEEISFTHLADISVTAITGPFADVGVVNSIDLISLGAEYNIG